MGQCFSDHHLWLTGATIKGLQKVFKKNEPALLKKTLLYLIHNTEIFSLSTKNAGGLQIKSNWEILLSALGLETGSQRDSFVSSIDPRTFHLPPHHSTISAPHKHLKYLFLHTQIVPSTTKPQDPTEIHPY